MPRKCPFTIEEQYEMISEYEDGRSSVELSAKYGKAPSTIHHYLRKFSIPTRSNKINSRKFEVDHSYFKNIDDEHKAYWWGFICADGYLTCGNKVCIALAECDIEHLKKFAHDINTDYSIKTYKKSIGKNYSRIQITSDEMYKDLKCLGVIEHKSLKLAAPEIEDIDLKRHFIRGYYDGDGSISYYKVNYWYAYKFKITGTTSMLNFIKDFIENNTKIKVGAFYKRRKNDTDNYSFDIGGNIQVVKLLELLYYNSTIYLDRKYERYMTLYNHYNSRFDG